MKVWPCTLNGVPVKPVSDCVRMPDTIVLLAVNRLLVNSWASGERDAPFEGEVTRTRASDEKVPEFTRRRVPLIVTLPAQMKLLAKV